MITQQANEFERATVEYLGKFPLKVRVTLGGSYTDSFIEFHAWCTDNLGIKYKDWFLVNVSKSDYVLHISNPKWLSILALRFSERIDILNF